MSERLAIVPSVGLTGQGTHVAGMAAGDCDIIGLN